MTLRQRGKIHLAEQAERYIEYQSMQQSRGGRSAVREPYDETRSRQEWARQFQ